MRFKIKIEYFFMETVVVQINNSRAISFLENLEALNVIKMLKRIPYSQSEIMKETIDVNSDRVARLSEIRSITRNINIDLTNFKFNRDEANNYD